MSSLRNVLTSFFLASGFLCQSAIAQEANLEPNNNSKAKTGDSVDAAKSRVDVQSQKNSRPAKRDSEPSKEDSVLEFVKTHQPKLGSLLNYLREKRPSEFRQVMKEFARVQQRLQSLSKRDKEMHEIELKLWKIRSEQRLVAAEMATAKSPKRLEEQLEKLVASEYAKNLERLTLQRSRIKKQLAQLESQIERQKSSKSDQIERSLKQWQNKIERQTSTQNKSAKKKAN